MAEEQKETEDKPNVPEDKPNVPEDKPKIYEKSCPYCEKPFFSLSEKQLLFNYTSHIGSCKFKNEKKKAAKELKEKKK